ncbi:hypothetical protein EVAR_102682_1 [Eumeta japonica]|uniref:Uncharacterized protein n=1 Tax=Eumeta variegata TaxID=151549 RepID=A0A4C1TUX0_EUMVA|nr:hypothetical protein EVAR_102682_1 [Eumeta japonica]
MWAIPGGTAMPGRPVTGVERAPNTPSCHKNQFNILYVFSYFAWILENFQFEVLTEYLILFQGSIDTCL